MVRISDILKKKLQPAPSEQESKPEKKPEPPEPEKVEPPKPSALPEASTLQIAKAMTQKEPLSKPEEQKPQEMQIAKAMKELESNVEHSKALYSKGIQLVKELLRSVAERKPIELPTIKDLVGELVNYLVLGDKTLFSLFYEDYPPNDYLCNHMVNVTIMSIGVALGLGYNKSKLNELGLAAFLHDIGMVKVEKLALQPRKLSEEEYNQIKEHPIYNVEISSQVKDIPKAVVDVVKEVHERMNGKGYPSGLKDGEISEYGRIIATVDIYEALTHDRTYRKKYPPHEAIKDILSSGSLLFDTRILKILIGQVGIYPISSWVELNTNEVGKIIAINDESPLRSVVNILFDSQGNRLPQSRVVNLAKQFNLFIKKPLSDEDILRLTEEK